VPKRADLREADRRKVTDHARLCVVVESHESPVCDHTGDSLLPLEVRPYYEIFNGRSVHHNDVRHGEDLGKDGRGEQRRVLDDDKSALVLERYTDLLQETVCRLTDNHGRHELATKPVRIGDRNVRGWKCSAALQHIPCATSGSDIGLEDGYFEVWASLRKVVRAG
jgi:hypothetical protein